MGRYVLPDLGYDYGALEPHISGRIMELHHDKHHRAYVEAANGILDRLAEVRSTGKLEHVGELEAALAFNASGHVLHSLFWRSLAPHGGGAPGGTLSAQIQHQFGSCAVLKAQMSRTAETIMGSGWAALVWEPVSGELAVAQIRGHQSSTIQGAVPLLVIDAWEHAYYLQYENAKTRYVEAIWNVCDWGAVARRFDAARASGLGSLT